MSRLNVFISLVFAVVIGGLFIVSVCSECREEKPTKIVSVRICADDFIFLREERVCFPSRWDNLVKVYLHEKTGLEFVLIPGGQFLMGSPDDEIGRTPNEGPQRLVGVQQFFLCRTEVSNRIFRKFRESHESNSPPGLCLNGDDQPVIVDWHEAVDWCDEHGLRLPTDAEWEYACRAGTLTPRYWGDANSATALLFENLADLSFVNWDDWNYNSGIGFSPKDKQWPYVDANDGYAGTAPVGSFLPNGFGLFDMLGNVSEWVKDGYYPFGPYRSKVFPEYKIYRGGSWRSLNFEDRSASRGIGYSRLPPDWDHHPEVGFRPAASIHPLKDPR